MKKFLITFKELPQYYQLIFIATAIAIIGGKGIFGFRISGLTWFIPFIFSLIYLVPRLDKITFPWKIWVPWCILLASWLFFTQFPALQRSAQLICPIIVGICASTIAVSEKALFDLIKFCRYFALILGAICISKSGLSTMGAIPYNPGLAAELMTGLLLSALFAASYSYGYKKDLRFWVFLCTFPVYGLFRSGIAIAGMTLPFTFAPLKLYKRMLFLAVALPVALGIFYLPTIQNEMFYSGHGTLQDILSDNFDTSGRKQMASAVRLRTLDNPLLGHGTGGCEYFIRRLTNGLQYPHNDWLLTAYDYGAIGVWIFGLTILAAALHALKMVKKVTLEAKILFKTGAYSFVILAMMMLSDNIMVYASFFGNIQFMFLGIAYSAAYQQQVKRTQTDGMQIQDVKIRTIRQPSYVLK